jgi:hypothetical protein
VGTAISRDESGERALKRQVLSHFHMLHAGGHKCEYRRANHVAGILVNASGHPQLDSGPSNVAAVIASILLEALRMSFKKEASCRIDNPCLFENVRAYPCLQAAPRHQIDLAPNQSFQFLAQRLELERPNTCVGVNSTMTGNKSPRGSRALVDIAAGPLSPPRTADPNRESSLTP